MGDLGTASALKLDAWFSFSKSEFERLRFHRHTSTLVGHKVFVVGGLNQKVLNNKVFTLDYKTDTWEVFLNDLPEALLREFHKTVLFEDSLYVYGGTVNDAALNDLWQVDLVGKDVERCQLYGTGPGLLSDVSVDFIEATGDIVVFGGRSETSRRSNAVHTLDMQSKSWHDSRVTGSPPSARTSHSTTSTYRAVYVFGGYNATGYLEDLYMLEANADGYVWSQPQCTGKNPSARLSATLSYCSGRLFLVGGFGRKGSSLEFSVLSLKDDHWIETWETAKPAAAAIRIHGGLPRLMYHTTVVLPSKLLIIGGGAANRLYSINVYEADDFYKRPSRVQP